MIFGSAEQDRREWAKHVSYRRPSPGHFSLEYQRPVHTIVSTLTKIITLNDYLNRWIEDRNMYGWESYPNLQVNLGNVALGPLAISKRH